MIFYLIIGLESVEPKIMDRNLWNHETYQVKNKVFVVLLKFKLLFPIICHMKSLINIERL